MRKRRFYAILMLVGMFVVVLFLLRGVPEGEPRYRGKRLSEWMMQYFATVDAGPVQRREQAADAIRHIGTNAIPYLLKWIRYERPPWKRKLEQEIQELPLLGDLRLPNKEMDRVFWAREAFAVLGPTAKGAIPDLTQLMNMNQTNSATTVGSSMYALAHLGPEALPPFVTALTNQQKAVRKVFILHHMVHLGTNASPAMPVLIDCIHDKDENVAASAIQTLVKLQLQPSLVVPVLRDSLQDTRARVRRDATLVLGEFAVQARPAVSALQKLLEDPETRVREAATNALRRIDPQALEKPNAQ